MDERAALLLGAMTTEEKLSQLNYRNAAIPRLGIPAYVWWNEALHGLARSGSATVFPQAIGMAATFNPGMVFEMASIIATEGRARHHESVREGDFGTYKGLTYWSPNVNIFRDPRWGRGHETYGEDPFLSGAMGAAYVRGIQGSHPIFFQAVATPKHFAVHSGPESTRLSFNSVVGEHDLRETYLPAFEACFEAGAASVMTAYNAINGEPCSTNERLIGGILRGEWGFRGAVVTDAGAGEALYKEHRLADDYPEALAREVSRGVDVVVDWEQGAIEAYERGLLQIQDIDRAVFNQLLVKFRLGFFNPPEEVPRANTPYEVIECEHHREAAQRASLESLVLLRNRGGLLPLDASRLKNVAVIGPNADARDVLLGNYHGTPTRQVTMLEGIRRALEPGCRVWHARGCEWIGSRTEPCAEDDDRIAEAISAAKRSDAVLLCLGLNPGIEGEAGDAFNAEAGGDRVRIELPAAQENLVRRVAKCGKPIVVLMLCGSAIISEAVEECADAILHCWYPGAEGGDAVARTLLGRHNPSGRLPVTFYRRTTDLPEFQDYSMRNRTHRFFTGSPAYPFGFGLSYSRFSYEKLELVSETGGLVARVLVANSSHRDGEEVVQIYSRAVNPSIPAPRQSLVGIAKISLAQGARASVDVPLAKMGFLLVDPDGQWVPHSGEWDLIAAGACPVSRSFELGAPQPVTLRLPRVPRISSSK